MSKQINAFFEAVRTDEKLRTELQACPNEDAFFRLAVRRGAERGYTFTVDEVREGSRGTQLSSQLSEGALESVVGGQASYQTVTSYRFCTWEWLGC